MFALPVLLVAAFVFAFLAVPSSASAAFGVKNFKYTNTPAPEASLPGTQAASHPNVTVSFERTGSESEDLKDVQLKMPTGVFPNPEAVATKCTATQFSQDKCPAGSNVGAVTVDVKAMSLLPLTIHGTVDVLTPDSDSVATLGISLRPDKICILFIFCAVPEKIFLKTNAVIDTYNDHGVATITGGSPKSSVIGIPLIVWTPTITGDITVNKMELSFQSRAGEWGSKKVCGGFLNLICNNVAIPPSGNYFWQQTTSCMPATASLKLTSYQNATASATSTFTPTGCNNVPFNPQLVFTPQNTDSNKPTSVSFKMTQPDADAEIQQAFPKFVDADLPAGSGLDLSALAGVDNCTEAQLQAHSCPASSEIGNAYAFSKFMPGANASTPGLTGKVYAMSVTSQIDMAVQLDGPRGAVIVLRGTMGARDGHVYSVFDRIPQVPFREFGLTVTKAAYKNPVACGTANSSVRIVGYNGTASTSGNGTEVTRSTAYNVGNCATPPNTTITGHPLAETTLSHASFSFTSDQSGSTFQCSIDNSEWAPCTSPWTSQALALGSHTFKVKALKGTAEDPTPASYSFTVVPSDYAIEAGINVSNTQAVAHPNLDATFDIIGNGSPKDLSLKMPLGFAASLAAVPACDHAAGAAGNCQAASKVGTAELTITKDGGATHEVGTGNIYLTDGPTANDAGGVAANIQFADGTVIATGGAYLVENGLYQYLELRDIPNSLNGNEFQATKLVVHLLGNEGGNRFLTNPSNCFDSAWDASSIDHDGNEAPAFNVPFAATGCSSVPFGPVLTQTLATPQASATTGVRADLAMPVDNAAILSLQVDEPRVIKPNFQAFGTPADQCTAASVSPSFLFDPTPCPAQAEVGTMTLNTPLLPDPLEGKVYLIEASPIPWLGVVFDAPGIHVTLIGQTSTPKVNPACNPQITPGGCPTRISIVFQGVPDVQVSSLTMDLNGPARQGVNELLSGNILQLASANDAGCVTQSVASSTITPWSDYMSPITQDQTITVNGCNH